MSWAFQDNIKTFIYKEVKSLKTLILQKKYTEIQNKNHGKQIYKMVSENLRKLVQIQKSIFDKFSYKDLKCYSS